MDRFGQAVISKSEYLAQFEEVIAEFAKHRNKISKRALDYMQMQYGNEDDDNEEEQNSTADILEKYGVEVVSKIPEIQDGDMEELLAYKRMFTRENPNNVARLFLIERLMPKIQATYKRGNQDFRHVVSGHNYVNQAWMELFIRIGKMVEGDDPKFISVVRGAILQAKIDCMHEVVDMHGATNDQYVRKVENATEAYKKETGDDPTPEELSDITGFSVDGVKGYIRQSKMKNPISTNQAKDKEIESEGNIRPINLSTESTEDFVMRKADADIEDIVDALRETGGDALVDIVLHETSGFADELVEELGVPNTKKQICKKHNIKPEEYNQMWNEYKDALVMKYSKLHMLKAV